MSEPYGTIAKRIREAVDRILIQNPEGFFTSRDVSKLVIALGYPEMKGPTISSTLKRLEKEKVIACIARGFGRKLSRYGGNNYKPKEKSKYLPSVGDRLRHLEERVQFYIDQNQRLLTIVERLSVVQEGLLATSSIYNQNFANLRQVVEDLINRGKKL